MNLRETIARLLLGERDAETPSCPGCGRPVVEQGDVCADCSGSATETYGG